MIRIKFSEAKQALGTKINKKEAVSASFLF